jgi:hypothetical protein
MVQNTTRPQGAIKNFAKDMGDSDWGSFPGGELEGKRPKVLCKACRRQLNERAAGNDARGAAPQTRRHDPRPPLCFQCYRAEIDRERALRAAAELDTASVERFQTALPFEPVNLPRLEMLKAERSAARASALANAPGKFPSLDVRRRQAQIAARHALQRIAANLASRSDWKPTAADREREMAAAIHAAELQLPESWLPFVVSQ